MVRLRKSKKGSVLAWLVALVFVFVVGLVYIVMTRPFEMVYDDLYPGVDADHQSTFAKINNVWIAWPIIIILGIILWAVVESVNRNRGYSGM